MTKIILLRHGETEWNRLGKYQGQSDIALSEKGRCQAQTLAAHFPVRTLQAAYASDLQRAMETARVATSSFGCTVTAEPRLREVNFGDWEGLTYAQISAGWPEAMEKFFQLPDLLEIPHGETFAEVQQRAMAALEEIAAAHEGETVLAAAHGAVNRLVVCNRVARGLATDRHLVRNANEAVTHGVAPDVIQGARRRIFVLLHVNSPLD